jgi:hypothetical protein
MVLLADWGVCRLPGRSEVAFPAFEDIVTQTGLRNKQPLVVESERFGLERQQRQERMFGKSTSIFYLSVNVVTSNSDEDEPSAKRRPDSPPSCVSRCLESLFEQSDCVQRSK